MNKRRIDKGFVARAIDAGMRWWEYFNRGVWEDSRRTRKVAFVKTLNLSMRSFLNSRLWVRAASLTYNTVLAIVPALALVLAICRGFGFSNLLESELRHIFPAQSDALSEGLKFVDSYLSTSSEGVFVGAGIVFLLWTLYSLMSNVEEAFNEAWSVHDGRSLWRQFTDYTAIFFILPVLMICSSGISLFLSSTVQQLLPSWAFVQGAMRWGLDLLSLMLVWLFFTGTYLLIPNTRVKFRNALVAGIFAGTGFVVVEWIFVSGQMYVARYNAIYGSFSFVPLLLIWLQLVWLITLAGAVICYAMQNIYNISYLDQVEDISIGYRERVVIAVMSVITQAHDNGSKAPTISSIAHDYRIPANLVSPAVARLERCKLISRLMPEKGNREPGLVPLLPTEKITVNLVLDALVNSGSSSFIPGFNRRFSSVCRSMDTLEEQIVKVGADMRLSDLKIEK